MKRLLRRFFLCISFLWKCSILFVSISLLIEYWDGEKKKDLKKESIRNLFLNSKNEREPTQKPWRWLESIMGKNSALKFEKDMITGERFIQRIWEMPAFVFLILSFYFLPTGIAFIRWSSEKWWILLLNLLIGWTGLGYVVCAFFAFSEEKR